MKRKLPSDKTLAQLAMCSRSWLWYRNNSLTVGTYVCFMDFKKAFDLIDTNNLLSVLKEHCIKGKNVYGSQMSV